MSIILYNKLVRDKVPEQIERSGKSCTVEVVDDDQYRALLDRKLDEEMDSYQAHRSADDLASLLELIHAAADARGWKWEELEQLRLKKRAQKGGYESGSCSNRSKNKNTNAQKERESICFRALL